MAARANLMEQNAGRREIVDLRGIAARDLEPVLADEIQDWQTDLDWDFGPSAELVRRYAGTSSLGGAALTIDGQVAGYGYAVLEEPRGIIGDVYVRPHLRDPAAEAALFRALLDALVSTPRIARMESQLMLFAPESAGIVAKGVPGGKSVRLYERRLMSRDSRLRVPEMNAALLNRFRIAHWQDHFMHAAGPIVAGAYKGEADSEINAQYRSPAGARRFLSNIVEFPGCGAFHPAASFVAFDAQTGEAAGMALTSFVARETGHLSQLCVLPGYRGLGLGAELLRMSVAALARDGAARVSLTVTASNSTAISLYEKFGFRAMRPFYAYIWEA